MGFAAIFPRSILITPFTFFRLCCNTWCQWFVSVRVIPVIWSILWSLQPFLDHISGDICVFQSLCPNFSGRQFLLLPAHVLLYATLIFLIFSLSTLSVCPYGKSCLRRAFPFPYLDVLCGFPTRRPLTDKDSLGRVISSSSFSKKVIIDWFRFTCSILSLFIGDYSPACALLKLPVILRHKTLPPLIRDFHQGFSANSE